MRIILIATFWYIPVNYLLLKPQTFLLFFFSSYFPQINLMAHYDAYRQTVKIKKSYVFSFFFDYFFNKIMQFNIRSQIMVKLDHIQYKFKPKIKSARLILKRFKKFRKGFKLPYKNLLYFIRIFVILFYLNDVVLFLSWLKQLAENVILKLHRRLLVAVRVVFSYFLKKNSRFRLCRGLYFHVRGKISGTGNAKSRQFLFKHGLYSITNNSYKVAHGKTTIRTKSGVLGCFLFLVS